MSDEGFRPGDEDEPTAAYRPPVQYGDDEATRMERPVTAYERERVYDRPAFADEVVPVERRSLLPLITTALVFLAIGLLLGYLLFNDSGDADAEDTTTTTVSLTTLPSTTTTSSTTTTTTAPTTTTTAATTTTRRSTTTTAAVTTTTVAVTTTSG